MICDKDLTNEAVVKLAQEMAQLPELQSLTFENNTIKDEDALCALFSNLRGYDRLENLNIRQNKFSSNMVNSLAQGIADKRELRVSSIATSTVSNFIFLCRLLTWVKMKSMIEVQRAWLMPLEITCAYTCFSLITTRSRQQALSLLLNVLRTSKT